MSDANGVVGSAPRALIGAAGKNEPRRRRLRRIAGEEKLAEWRCSRDVRKTAAIERMREEYKTGSVQRRRPRLSLRDEVIERAQRIRRGKRLGTANWSIRRHRPPNDGEAGCETRCLEDITQGANGVPRSIVLFPTQHDAVSGE